MKSAEFRLRYRLKSELAALCKEYGLPSSGAKSELTDYICQYLDGVPAETIAARAKEQGATRVAKAANGSSAIVPGDQSLTRDAIIAIDYRSDETHRAFFLAEIGPRFKFNVPFMNWMNAHRGQKTYGEAIDHWLSLEADKKNGKRYDIAPQFEYNRYTRAFFDANPHLTREDCLRCWNLKKQIPGSHAYEDSDLKLK